MKKMWWLLPAALLLVGCGSAEQRYEKSLERTVAEQSGGKTKVDLEAGGLKVEGEGFTQTLGNKAEVPAGFPTDVPPYPRGQVKAGQVFNGLYMVSWGTDDEMNQVKAFYDAALLANSWKIESNYNSTDQILVNAKKGVRGLTLSINPGNQDAGKTQISIQVVGQ